MAITGVRIDELDPAVSANSGHLIPAMIGETTVHLTIGQVATLVTALVVDGSPAALDTLNELAAALGDDPNFATTVTNSLATKLNITGSNIGGNLSTLQTALGISTFIKTLLDDADAGTAQTTLGISTFVKTLLDDADASTVLTTLGVSTFIKTLLDDANVGAAQTTLGISTFVKTILDDADATAVLTTLGLTVTAFAKTILDDADATTVRATLLAAGFPPALSTSQTDYPIGSILGFYRSTGSGGLPPLNSTWACSIDQTNGYAVIGAGGNPQLPGLWASRGRTGNDGSGIWFIMQRIS